MGCRLYKKLLVLGVLVLAICTLVFAYAHLISLMEKKKLSSDSIIFYTSGSLLQLGENPYLRPVYMAPLNPNHDHLTTIPNLCPPFTTMLFGIAAKWTSLSQFSWGLQFLNVVAGLIAVFLIAQYFFRKRRTAFIFLVVLLFSFVPSLFSILLVEPTFLINLLVVASFIFYKNKKDATCGALLGIAINIKLFLGLFILLFLAQKRYRALISFLVSLIILALIPLFIYGPFVYGGYITALSEVDWYPVNLNASYFGMLCRIFGGGDVRLFDSIWNYPAVTYIVYYLIGAAYIPILFKLCRRLERRPARAYSVFITSMLILSPLGWYYCLPLLLFSFIVYCVEAQEKKYVWIYWVLLALIILLFNLPFITIPEKTASLLYQLGVKSLLFVGLFLFHLAQLILSRDQSKQHHSMPNYKLLLIFGFFFFASSLVSYNTYLEKLLKAG